MAIEQIAAATAKSKPWFVPARKPGSVLALYNEYKQYLTLKAIETDKLPLPMAKCMNNRKTVYEQVLFLKAKKMEEESLSEEDALAAASQEIDAVVWSLLEPGAPFSHNKVVEYCRSQRMKRIQEEGKTIKNQGRTKSKDKGKNKAKE